MSRFVVPESLRGLGLDDRLIYLTIVGTLNVFVNISERPSPILTRAQRLETQRDALMNYTPTFERLILTWPGCSRETVRHLRPTQWNLPLRSSGREDEGSAPLQLPDVA